MLPRGRRSGRRPLARPSEHTAAAVAQAGTLTVHTGDDSVTIGNFGGAQPEHVSGAKPSLIVFGEGAALGGQCHQAHGQSQHPQTQVPTLESVSPHHRPQIHRCSPASCRLLVHPLASPSAKQCRRRIDDDRLRRAFNIVPAPCTTILPPVATSPQWVARVATANRRAPAGSPNCHAKNVLRPSLLHTLPAY